MGLIASISYTIIGLLIYSDVILNGVFVFDDFDYIVSNPLICDISSYVTTFGDLRYVVDLSFAFNYAVGGYNPFGYHLFNVIVHILNSILVFFLIGLIIETAGGKSSQRTWQATAFLTGFLFLVHPVQTQAISFVTQRFTSLAVFFYLLSILLYIKSRVMFEMNRIGFVKYVICILSIISTALAVKSKETAITIPFIMAVFELLLFKDSVYFKKRFFFLIPHALSLILIPISLFGPDWGLVDSRGVTEMTRLAKLHEASDLSSYEYLITQFRVIINYIGLLFLPIKQRVLYDYTASHSIFEIKVILSLCLLLLISWSAIYLWKKAKAADPQYAPAYRLFSIGIVWFFLTLSVESSIISIRDLIFEHRVYLPSVGFFASVSALISWLIGRKTGNSNRFTLVFFIVLLALGLPFSFTAYQRNKVWTDEVRFWTDVVEKEPRLYVFYYDRGLAYLRKNEYMPALQDVYKVLKRYSDVINEKVPMRDTDFSLKNLARAYVTKGQIFSRLGENDEANVAFEHSLKIMSGSLDMKDLIRPEDAMVLSLP
ncbi:MAG: hypothetical protein HZA10_07185 [Nitrospirae bacterium]|nr:hypothetical protein [Nitrospirota bacterium]